jgi:hypothetical protein
VTTVTRRDKIKGNNLFYRACWAYF